jgi:(E)-4-hydroxy-3-methylbut-2-enyl-diphosphate synthase
MRVSVLDFKPMPSAIKEIKKRIDDPFGRRYPYRLSFGPRLFGFRGRSDSTQSREHRLDDRVKIAAVVEACKAHHAPIRIGVNSGSLDKAIYEGKGLIKGEYLLESSAEKHVAILEKLGFSRYRHFAEGLFRSETIEAYRLANERFPYPLHLGITEAGPKDTV